MTRPAPGGPGDRLDRRTLNRALLERQLLLRRRKIAAGDAIEHLVGLQAQIPANPYVSLWSRLAGFAPSHLADLVRDRRAVRLALMRSTIHLVSANDSLALRPVIQPVLDRQLRASSFGRNLAGIDDAALVRAARVLLREPKTLAELGAGLARRWPDRDATSLAYAIRNLVPLVQIPPRGVWGESGQATHVAAETWLGRPLSRSRRADDVVLRYLAAFGPASVRDVQSWSGLTRLREVVDRLRPRLRTFRDEQGRELVDVPGAPLPDAETPAPPRFLPEFDNVLLGHHDRSRIFRDERQRTALIGRPTVLVDGTVGATWDASAAKGVATLSVRPLGRISRAHRAAVSEEGIRLLGLLAPAAAPDVRFVGSG
ncbi:MAG TPA: winged helix DNA-binding domain-containing protein [Actinomycetota bacterium]|nr:winged helix DNA-binding domain-containing protein [Actinomycetota bacterium]